MTAPEPHDEAYYRSRSLWFGGLPGPIEPRRTLCGSIDVDVAIVGAGYTGLYAAYYMAKADPRLRIAVLEREIAGFGASGRNGAWCSWAFAAPLSKLARAAGREAAIAMQRTMFDTVDEVGRVCAVEGIDAAYHKGGSLRLATIPAHVLRLQDEMAELRRWGFGEEDWRWLDADEAARRIALAGCHGAMYTPHCAVVDPARLVRGLAESVERLGVTIYERTPAVAVRSHAAVTPRGEARAPAVLLATEAYTARLLGHRRDVLPLYSLMIGTEPLPGEVWEEIGWHERECCNDARHLLIYMSRTADGRIAFGGRGAPYHAGSAIDDSFDRDERMRRHLRAALVELFPVLRDVRITHQWGGPIGVPRDWFSSVGFDGRSGVGWAGGYVGDGMATANLAGRTLADLVLERDSELTKLPWVGHRSPTWEPEPFRWLATNAALQMLGSADRQERRTGRPSSRADLIMRLIGR